MTNSEYLFYLIKSLSNNEKRFFSLSSQFYDGEKVYSMVFNVIDKMNQYDDEPLLKLMNGNKQKLAVTKNYLYNQILKSLRTHNEKESIEAQLYNLILDVETLRAKGLFQPALKRLKKARKMATDYEKSTFLMEIINVETDIRKETTNKKIQEEFEELFRQANQALDNYSEFIKLKELARKLYIFFIIGRKEQELPEAWVREIEALPSSADSLRSFYAKKYYHIALGYYNQLTGNIKKQKEQFGLRVDLWQQHPKMKINRYHEYRLDLSNYAICCLDIDNFEEVPDLISKIKKIPTKSKYEEASDFQNTAFIELFYYLRTGNLRKAISLENYIEKNILLYSGLINKSREITFYHNMMVAFFGRGDYKKASNGLIKYYMTKNQNPAKVLNVLRGLWKSSSIMKQNMTEY